jgi:hypothetical protein
MTFLRWPQFFWGGPVATRGELDRYFLRADLATSPGPPDKNLRVPVKSGSSDFLMVESAFGARCLILDSLDFAIQERVPGGTCGSCRCRGIIGQTNPGKRERDRAQSCHCKKRRSSIPGVQAA